MQFQGLPRIAAWVSSFLVECQAVEQALFDTYLLRLLDNIPTGNILDGIGKLVGQPRNAQVDSDYINFCRARIRTNRSDGRRETLIALSNLLMPAAGIVWCREGNKSIEIEMTGVVLNPYLVWRDFLQRAVDPGTRIRFISSTQPRSLVLTRSSVQSGVTVLSTQCKGSKSISSGLNGGVWAAAYG